MSVRRNLSAALPPKIKSLNFLNNILAKEEASQSGAFDGLMLNDQGHITECTTSNIFFVKERCLCTPSVECGILDGITREIVLFMAKEDSCRPMKDVIRRRCSNADESFLTNTTMEIMPVRRIDTQRIGQEIPGPITRRLQELFRLNLPRFLVTV